VPTTRQRGSHWELKAEAFLKTRGLRTIERNYLARVGEIDLVMMDGATLVFAEVRYRENERHGSGADSVTRVKQQRIIRAARSYLCRNPGRSHLCCRFDVISIGSREGRILFNWIQNAFDAG
jgi:putative endonuclease